MVRYVRQPTQSSCGPTAIINSIKWVGYRSSLKLHHTFLTKFCNTTREEGTDPSDFGRALKKMLEGSGSLKRENNYSVSIWRRNNPLYKSVIDHISKPDCAAVVLYYWKIKEYVEGHYMLITGVSPDGVVCINDRFDVTVSTMPLKNFSEILATNRDAKKDYPCVWFIRKNKL